MYEKEREEREREREREREKEGEEGSMQVKDLLAKISYIQVLKRET